jgi:hypothetical protein
VPEGGEFVTGVDENGKPANIGAGLDRFNRLTLFTPPTSHEVHLDPDSAAEFLRIVRKTDLSWRPS